MMCIKIFFTCILGVLSISSLASAETGPLGFGSSSWDGDLESDRPDFTESTSTIAPGHLQLEGGYTFVSDDENYSHTIPEFLLRIGAISDAELRLGFTGYIYENPDPGSAVDGFSDLVFGGKFKVFEQSASIPAISTIIDLSIPTGSSDISSDKLEPGAKLLWSYDLNDRLSVAGNTNLAYVGGVDKQYFEISASASLGIAISPVFGLYFEYFGIFPAENVPESDESYLNIGGTYLVSKSLQLDARIGGGLNDDADELFTGIGFAFFY